MQICEVFLPNLCTSVTLRLVHFIFIFLTKLFTMKIFIKVLIGFFTLLFLLFTFSYFWLKSTAPVYSGEKKIQGIIESVEITYDDFGVPHIYANNAHDAYFALGFAQAQERLFQMEMIRRATSGKLSEILGESLLAIDKIR